MGFMDGFSQGGNSLAMGFAQGDADAARRRNKNLQDELMHEVRGLNYQRLCARAWEEVATELAKGTVPVGPDDLQRLYLTKRRELFKAGRIKGRDSMGNPKAEHKIGDLNSEALAAVVKASP
jgi:hypothetical protein